MATETNLTELDLATCRDTHAELNEDPYFDPETVVLSTGYADVFPDGTVVQHNRVILNLEGEDER